MTLREIAISRKSRKGTSAAITPDGAYWLPIKISICAAGGDGTGQSAPDITDYLMVRHYRDGDMRAYAQREVWSQNNGTTRQRVRRDTLLDCQTIEEIIKTLVALTWHDEYYVEHVEVTPEGKQRLIDGLDKMDIALPGPDEI